MSENTKSTHTAGAFDIRTLIGGLLGLYGVILTITGIWFTDSTEKARVDGENLNLIVGIGLLVISAIFLGWVGLRPLRIPAEKPADE